MHHIIDSFNKGAQCAPYACWEHQIQNEDDFAKHMDYIHFNPVKHEYVKRAVDWPYSTFQRCMNSGIYPADWGTNDNEGEFGE